MSGDAAFGRGGPGTGHRQPLERALAGYRERHPEESATVDAMRTFVASHDDCFERTCRPGHITGSAWILDPDHRAALLTHHRKLDRWLQPGGHSDGDPDTLQVALREAREESGLAVTPLTTRIFDIDIHPIPARRSEPAHLHYDVRFLLAAAGRRFEVSDESHALAWVTMEEVHERTDEESVLRMVRKWRTWRESRHRPPSA